MDMDLNEGDFEVEEISEDEFNQGGSRNGGKWNKEAIKEFVKQAKASCSGKAFKYPISNFYTKFREDEGATVVKYASYYARKNLIEAFDEAGIKAIVKTVNTKNNSTQGDLKIAIKG